MWQWNQRAASYGNDNLLNTPFSQLTEETWIKRFKIRKSKPSCVFVCVVLSWSTITLICWFLLALTNKFRDMVDIHHQDKLTKCQRQTSRSGMPLINNRRSFRNIGPIITSHSTPLRTGVEATKTPHQRRIYMHHSDEKWVIPVNTFHSWFQNEIVFFTF